MQTIDMATTERLQPQDLLLTLLGNELLHQPDHKVWSGGLIAALGDHGFSAVGARAATSRLANRGLLDRSQTGREVFYRLSERAVAALTEGERRILEFSTGTEPTDIWTMLTYALSPAQRSRRDRLRRRLSFLGYGSHRDGMWIAPGDRVADTDPVLQELGLSHDVEMFVGAPAITTDVGRLVRSAWGHLDALGSRYEAFSARWSNMSRRGDHLTARTLLMHEWRTFPTLDPGLPDYLVQWAPERTDAAETFRRQWHHLAPGATARFAQLCRTDTQVSPPTSPPPAASIEANP
ncbi:MAG: phenylacetic acid degradation operon negative regulatory protein [Candidatus Poriferisodalaceae bacterium]|jgi:phenylacetic acid degradation operon negative regulatory protein